MIKEKDILLLLEEQNKLLKEIKEALDVFKEFVFEVTPQEAREEIKELS